MLKQSKPDDGETAFPHIPTESMGLYKRKSDLGGRGIDYLDDYRKDYNLTLHRESYNAGIT